jgi:MFS family permease
VLGMVSGIVAGIIADKNEKNSLLTKSWICMAGSIVALPMIALATLQTSYFNLSMVCFSIFTFFAAAFSGSAITMLQNVSTKEEQGVATSLYFTCITIAQSFGPLVCGFIENYFKA